MHAERLRASADTHNIKSCSQLGLLPLTAIVVDLTFWSLSVTYVWNLSTATNTDNNVTVQSKLTARSWYSHSQKSRDKPIKMHMYRVLQNKSHKVFVTI